MLRALGLLSRLSTVRGVLFALLTFAFIDKLGHDIIIIEAIANWI
jgi:hypothetical protein